MKHANRAVRPPQRSVWHYSQADWDRARERIETFDWDAGMVEDINLSWSRWHTNFMSIMEECIPKKILTSRKNLPWLSKNIKKAMRNRNSLYKKLATVLNTRLHATESPTCSVEPRLTILET